MSGFSESTPCLVLQLFTSRTTEGQALEANIEESFYTMGA